MMSALDSSAKAGSGEYRRAESRIPNFSRTSAAILLCRSPISLSISPVISWMVSRKAVENARSPGISLGNSQHNFRRYVAAKFHEKTMPANDPIRFFFKVAISILSVRSTLRLSNSSDSTSFSSRSINLSNRSESFYCRPVLFI